MFDVARRKFIVFRLTGWLLLAVCPAFAQTEARQVGTILGDEIISPQVTLFQIKQYVLNRAAKPPVAKSVEQWDGDAKRLRQQLLNEVVFHGWPKDWVSSPPKFEDLGLIESGKGYRTRKLRYEIVPGFWSSAILYEPEKIQGRAPAIVNVNGHVGPPGKAVEYKQKRCINFAKRGIFALNLEWFFFGELAQKGNEHWFAAHLDLVGANGLGMFFLAMRRGLDYLDHHPEVDRNRLGVTGLSGGGWQTLTLSALDERVKVAVPVAGFASTRARVEAIKHGDLGDLEQSATDFLDGHDYAHLVALRAPRPTLLAYNAEDNCCFRAGMAKPDVFDAVRPIFRLYGKEELLSWHENRDPGTHNYQLDNRLQAYRFFSRHFGLPIIEEEIPSDSEIKSYDELVVGLPQDNLTLLGLARKFGRAISRPPIPTDSDARRNWAETDRNKLKQVIQIKPVSIARPWAVGTTKNGGLETTSYLFEMNNGLSANGVLLRAIGIPEGASVTLVLNDKGKAASKAEISDRVNRGEQVLAVDLLFTGDAWKNNEPDSYAQIIHGMGERSIGLVVAQLLEITHWLQRRSGVAQIRLEVSGMRNQTAALIAAALEPNLFSEMTVHEGISSLGYLLEKPVHYDEAPELFCLDLYRHFDFDRLAAVAAPVRVKTEMRSDSTK